MPALIDELAALKLKGTWLDGEVVVLGPDGLPHFNALQNAFDGKATSDITYFVFDVPYFEGHDLRAAPLRERRALLEAFLEQHPSEHVRFSSGFDADPANLMRSAEQLKLEGILAKRDDAPYVSRRTDSWLKLKAQQRQEFVIAGFTDRGGDATSREIGSLLLGVHDDSGQLVPAGNVGTGWSGKTAAELKQRLLKLEIAQDPVRHRTGRQQTLGAPRRRARTLGQAATGGRDRVCRLDARRPHPPRQVRGPAHRQARPAGGRARRWPHPPVRCR